MTATAPSLGCEEIPADEAEAIANLAAQSEATMRKKSSQPTQRDQHPKSHGYAQGEFVVADDLPELYRQGLFANPGSYACWVRFSNGSSKRNEEGKFFPDAQRRGDVIDVTPDIRGLAVKVLGVSGEAVPEAEGRPGQQDLIMINSPVFFIRNVVDYLVFFRVMAAIAKGKINFRAQPPVIPAEDLAAVQQVKYALDLVGKIQNSEKGVNSPLQTTFWSATPYKLGEAAMKYAMIPVATEPRFDPSQAVDLENVFREAISSQLARTEAQFDVLVQIQTDAEAMPIEDPTVLWDESRSPYVKVATLRLPQQDINSPSRLAEDERQSFSPWHCLAAHRPLGGVNRARRMYGHLARERNKDNQAE
jgi:hypothetical protein